MDRTLPLLLKRVATEHPSVCAQYSRTEDGSFAETTYAAFYAVVLDLAGGLLSLGHARLDHIGLIADNRKEWLQTSFAIMSIGAADVPRGCDATEAEIAWILGFSECKTAFLENGSQARKVLSSREKMPLLSRIILFDSIDEGLSGDLKSAGFEVLFFSDLLKKGAEWRLAHKGAVEAELEKGDKEDLATIIYTSGTTGEPKGVMLVHRNFLSQLPDLEKRITLNPGEKALSVLPVWHSFERQVEYVILNRAGGIVYSKPIGSVLLSDFATMNPQLLPSVPRIWESVHDGIYRAMRKTGGITWKLFSFFVFIGKVHARFVRYLTFQAPVFNWPTQIVYMFLSIIPSLLLWPLKALGNLLVFKKIRQKVGNAFRGGVSGGGALPPNIDEFFWAVGINVVEGYGLTETAPVVAVRPFVRPIFGTIGRALSCCSVRIIGEDGNELPAGEKGTVYVKGDNVMKGYYKRDDLTKAVLSEDGWLNTGDLGFKTLTGEIILRGREKDTIVLRGGENVEPTPIEMKINESRYIAQSVVLGQDQRYLAALIIPSAEEVEAWAENNGISAASYRELLLDSRVKRLIDSEVAELISARNGFKIFERISRIALLEKPFEQGVELSAKQEVMRSKIESLYKKEVRALFD